jgi:hypothetical protein
VEYDDHPRKSVTDIRSKEQYNAEPENVQRHPVSLVDKRTSDGLKEALQDTLPKTKNTINPGISNTPVPEPNVAVTQMYDNHMHKGLHDSSPVALDSPGRVSASPRFKVSATLPAAVEDSHRCDKSQPCDDMVPEGRSSQSEPRSPIAASTRVQHLVTLASSQQLRMTRGGNSVSAPVADDTKELEYYLVEAATAYVSQNRNEHTSVQAAYGMRINDHRRQEGSEQVSEGHVTDWHGQGRSSPRPGTSISTILSPVPFTLSNNKDNGSATSTGNHSGQALLRTSVHVEASDNKDSGIPGAPLGKLANAREQLRLLLRGPGRRRYRRSRSLFPSSP